MLNVARSIPPLDTPCTTPKIDGTDRQGTLHVGPTGIVPRGVPQQKSRASNEARAWLYTAVDELSPAYKVGVFLANHARYATKADRKWKVKPGDIFAYWPQKKIAAELGCSVRTIKRGVRSLRQAGVITVRQRVRPYGASCVFVRPGPSGVPSGVPSHREPRTEPRTEEKNVHTVGKPTNFPSKRAETGQTKQQRLVAAVCVKLGFSVTAAGLEEFDESPNTDKQKLIRRLLKAEAWHDRRAAQPTGGKPPPTAKTPNETGGQKARTGGKPPPGPNGPPAANTKSFGISAKTQKVQVEPFQGRPRSGRLLAEYADRYRAAHVWRGVPSRS